MRDRSCKYLPFILGGTLALLLFQLPGLLGALGPLKHPVVARSSSCCS